MHVDAENDLLLKMAFFGFRKVAWRRSRGAVDNYAIAKETRHFFGISYNKNYQNRFIFDRVIPQQI